MTVTKSHTAGRISAPANNGQCGAADIKVDATSIKGRNTYTRVGRHICIVLKVYEKGKYQVPKLF
jgi:hypothetical protein